MKVDPQESTKADLKSEIEITKTNLYVFGESKTKKQWLDLLLAAEKELASGNTQFAENILNKVKDVISNLWRRIFIWQDLQKNLYISFALLIACEIILIVYFYLKGIDVFLIWSLLFGLLGGSISTIFGLGKNLEIENSNKLFLTKILIKPLIGMVSGLIAYILIEQKIFIILPNLDKLSQIILSSFFAGFTERFIIKSYTDVT